MTERMKRIRYGNRLMEAAGHSRLYVAHLWRSERARKQLMDHIAGGGFHVRDARHAGHMVMFGPNIGCCSACHHPMNSPPDYPPCESAKRAP